MPYTFRIQPSLRLSSTIMAFKAIVARPRLGNLRASFLIICLNETDIIALHRKISRAPHFMGKLRQFWKQFSTTHPPSTPPLPLSLFPYAPFLSTTRVCSSNLVRPFLFPPTLLLLHLVFLLSFPLVRSFLAKYFFASGTATILLHPNNRIRQLEGRKHPKISANKRNF